MPEPVLPPDSDFSLRHSGEKRARFAFMAGRRVVLGTLLLLALGGAGYYYSTQQQSGTEAGGPGGPGGPGGRERKTPIMVEAAERGDFPVRLSAIGTVVPRTVVTVRSRVDGTLNRLHFEEGQTVRAGQLLAEIDPRPFEVALTQALGQLGKDEALLANARADLARYEGLARLDAISGQQLDTQKALVRQYEAAVKADQGTVDNARLQLSYTRVSAPAEGRVGLRLVDPGNMVRASDSAGLVVITQVQPVTVVFPIAEAELGKLLTRLGMKTARAAERHGKGAGDEGQNPAKRAGKDGADGRRARSSQETASGKPAGDGEARKAGSGIVVEAWDREGKVLLATGELLTVDNQIDVSTGTVKVKAIFANQDGALFPNQFVNVRLVVAELKDAVITASAAIQRGARGSFVWLLNEDKTVSMRPVSIAAVDADRVAIREGLESGEQVAIDGFDRLREGGKVEVVSSEARAVKGAPGKRGGKGKGGKGPEGAATPPADAKATSAGSATPAAPAPATASQAASAPATAPSAPATAPSAPAQRP